MAWHICLQDIFVEICRAVGSGIMTGNKIITVNSIRRGRRTQQAKRKAPKQSDDYHDGHIKHADRTAKFTRVFQTGKFGCFYFLCLVKHSRALLNAGLKDSLLELKKRGFCFCKNLVWRTGWDSNPRAAYAAT